MVVLRFLLIVMLTMSASFSAATDIGHSQVRVHDHASIEMDADGRHVCCEDSTEHARTCHVLPAVVPAFHLHDHTPEAGADMFFVSDAFLSGISPSRLLDPPRTV